VELFAILALVALAAGGMFLGRRIRASSGTVGAPLPPGTPGIVQAPLEPTGTVQLGGEAWTARSADEQRLPRDTRVQLVRFDGLTAIVEPAEPLPEPSLGPPASPADTGA
jgi:membrane protein implicated in regulation of membrane protease activity